MATLEEQLAKAERDEKAAKARKQNLKTQIKKRDAKIARKQALAERKRLEDEYIKAGKLFMEKVKPWMLNKTLNYTLEDGRHEQLSVFQVFEIEVPTDGENAENTNENAVENSEQG